MLQSDGLFEAGAASQRCPCLIADQAVGADAIPSLKGLDGRGSVRIESAGYRRRLSFPSPRRFPGKEALQARDGIPMGTKA
jgi:hypothetical protein